MTIKDDKTRPYKAYAAAAAAVLMTLISQGRDVLPPWALLVLTALVAGIATYVVPNPKVETMEKPLLRNRGEGGHATGPYSPLIWVLAIVGIVLLILILVNAIKV